MSKQQKTTETYNMPEKVDECKGFFKHVPYQLSDEQWEFCRAVWDKNNIAVMCNAAAGTSKTTLAVGMAMLMAYEFRKYSSIYYIISNCQEGELGFLPGSLEEKTAAYMAPLRSALVNWGYDPNKVIVSENNPMAEKTGDAIIHAMPHTFMRGSDISNAFIIIEECQNFKLKDLQKVLTRFHDDCKIVIIGHSGQVDLKYSQESGFLTYYNAAQSCDFIKTVYLTENRRGKFSNWADNILK